MPSLDAGSFLRLCFRLAPRGASDAKLSYQLIGNIVWLREELVD